MKAVVAAFNQEKALVGAFSVITNLRMQLFEALTQAAGYVNIASKKRMLSFAREKLAEDWDYFSHLTMNVRGDGRKYMINIQVKRDFDLLWNDRWHYPLYTRGGPYWQYVKIPWSKFYLGSRGVLQDKQFAIPLSKTP